MKKGKVHKQMLKFFLLALILTGLLFSVTLRFIFPIGVLCIPIFLGYFGIIIVILLCILEKKKTKDDWYGLFSGIATLIVLFTFWIGYLGELNEFGKNIVAGIFFITLLISIILNVCWMKYDIEK